MKATGEGAEEFPFGDGKKYFDNEIQKPPPEKSNRPADVIENDDPRVNKLETKFIKDILEMMEGHKKPNVEIYAAAIREQKRKLLLEKLRRVEAGIAEREGAKT